MSEELSREEKVKKTLLDRYGVDSPSKISFSEEIKRKINEKRRKTCLERYGVDSPSKISFSEEKKRGMNEKRRKTCLERYGVDNINKSEEIQNRKRENNLRKYGVKSTNQLPTIIKKKQFKYDSIFKAGHYKEAIRKAKETNMKKYGAENIMQVEKFKKLAMETKQKNKQSRFDTGKFDQ